MIGAFVRASAGAALAVAGLAPAGRTQAELRGVWVARDGLTSRQQIATTLDQLAAANINVVCVNVWSRGFTIHPSDVLLAACGQRQDPTYVGRDPLQEFVVEAHRRGIEVEAWFEYGFLFGWSGWFAGPSGIGPVLSANPAWIARDRNGNSQVSDGNGGFFTWAVHEHPDVRRFLIDLAVEVVDRYDVDGIQFDRVRYPSTSFGYDAVTSAAYQAATNQLPPTNPDQAQWKRWRADRLTAFHVDLHRAIALRRPTVRVTDAPTVMPGAYDNFLQDWPAWLVAGSLDLVYPQVYRTTAGAYTTTLDQQLAAIRAVDRPKVAPGIRAITGTPTTEVLAMVAANRQRGLPGHVFWYAEGLYDDLPALRANFFQASAAVPLRPAGFRPPPVAREENDPSTLRSAGFVLGSVAGSSGGQAAIALGTASPADRVQFVLPVAETGLHAVLVHVPAGPGLSAAAPHAIAHAAGVEVRLVDQATPLRAGWNELGTVWLLQGQTTVEVRAVPGQAVVADAVALLRSRLLSGGMAALGAGSAGAFGAPSLSLTGRACLGGELRLQTANVPPSATVLWALGFQAASTPLLGGTLHLVPVATDLAFADAAGRADRRVALPFDPGLHGLTVLAQALALDAAAVGGASLTNAVLTTLP